MEAKSTVYGVYLRMRFEGDVPKQDNCFGTWNDLSLKSAISVACCVEENQKDEKSAGKRQEVENHWTSGLARVASLGVWSLGWQERTVKMLRLTGELRKS